jgi:hypothetical protein
MVADSTLTYVTLGDVNYPVDMWEGIPQVSPGLVDIATPDEEPYDGYYDTMDADPETTQWLVVGVGVQTDTIAHGKGEPARAAVGTSEIEARRAAQLAYATEQKVILMRASEAAREILAADRAAQTRLVMPVTLTQLLAEPIEESNWRVNGLWPTGGNVMLAAGPKAGKTHVLINLIRALVDGDRLFDSFPVNRLESGKVTALDFELPRQKWREWLGQQRIIRGDQVNTWALRGQGSTFNMLDKSMRIKWADALARLETRILTVDCLAPILAGLGLDENSQRDVGGFLEGLAEMAVRAGIEELVIVHHMGHSGDRMRGSSGLAGWPDAIWSLVRQKPEPAHKGAPVVEDPRAPREFSAFGRDVDMAPALIEYDAASGRIRLPGALSRVAEYDRRIELIVSFVGENDGAGLRAIGRAIGEGNETGRAVREAIERAKSDGLLSVSPSGGGHSLTAEGRAFHAHLRQRYAHLV